MWAYRIDLGSGAGGGRNQQQVAGFGTREDAEAALAGFLELVWLPAKFGEVDRSTFDQYAWAVRRHIVPGLGQFKLVELEPAVLDRWLRRLGSAGRQDGGRSLSTTSVRLVRKVLSMACTDAVERGFLADNPVKQTRAPDVTRPDGAVWTADEAGRFLATASGHRLGPAFHLAVVAALRRGELLGLRWRDLDFDAGRLRVAQQLMVEGGRARLKALPDRDARTVLLPPSLMQMLLEHRNRQDAELAADAARNDDDLVFRAPGGGWLTPERFTRVMNELIKKSRVRRITPNGLRRAGPLLAHRAPTGEAESR